MTHEEIANNLLTPIWRGIPSDYKRKYARNIWTQFESNLKSAANTASLSKFFQRLTQRLAVEITTKDCEIVMTFIQNQDDRTVLKALREETALLVLFVRVANEERKAEFEVRKTRKRKEPPNASTTDGRDSDLSIFDQP
jgi:hypothetical protein